MFTIDPTTYYAYDPDVHPLPSPAVAAPGDRVNSYDGPGTVIEVAPDQFYGQPPVSQGDPVPGKWDGLAYTVQCDNGRTTKFDRSRIRRIS